MARATAFAVALAALSALSALFSAQIYASIGSLYRGPTELKPGMIVSLAEGNSEEVKAATLKDVNSLFGVVISNDKANDPEKPVEVATTGVADALVSDVQGEIKKGDPVSASAIEGIGAKNIDAPRLLGLAQEDFNTDGPGTTKKTIKGKDGASKEVTFGSLSLLIGVADYSQLPAPQSQRSYLPAPVYAVFDSVGGQQTSSLRAGLAIMIMIITFIIIGVLIYSSIRGSLTALGRNPLASRKIVSSLVKVFAISAAVGFASLALIYATIKIHI